MEINSLSTCVIDSVILVDDLHIWKLVVSIWNLFYCALVAAEKKCQAKQSLMIMPCKYYVSVCNSIYDTDKEYVKVHSFQSDLAEKQR